LSPPPERVKCENVGNDGTRKLFCRKVKKKINKTKSSDEVRAVRSLHYIDDEDFDDTRERGLARKAALEEKEKQEKAEAAERAQKLPFGKALLKKDDRKNENEEETSEDETNTDDTTNNE
jgi:hypothetical protein